MKIVADIHDPAVKNSKIKNFRSWSLKMVPDFSFHRYGLDIFVLKLFQIGEFYQATYRQGSLLFISCHSRYEASVMRRGTNPAEKSAFIFTIGAAAATVPHENGK